MVTPTYTTTIPMHPDLAALCVEFLSTDEQQYFNQDIDIRDNIQRNLCRQATEICRWVSVAMPLFQTLLQPKINSHTRTFLVHSYKYLQKLANQNQVRPVRSNRLRPLDNSHISILKKFSADGFKRMIFKLAKSIDEADIARFPEGKMKRLLKLSKDYQFARTQEYFKPILTELIDYNELGILFDLASDKKPVLFTLIKMIKNDLDEARSARWWGKTENRHLMQVVNYKATRLLNLVTKIETRRIPNPLQRIDDPRINEIAEGYVANNEIDKALKLLGNANQAYTKIIEFLLKEERTTDAESLLARNNGVALTDLLMEFYLRRARNRDDSSLLRSAKELYLKTPPEIRLDFRLIELMKVMLRQNQIRGINDWVLLIKDSNYKDEALELIIDFYISNPNITREKLADDFAHLERMPSSVDLANDILNMMNPNGIRIAECCKKIVKEYLERGNTESAERISVILKTPSDRIFAQKLIIAKLVEDKEKIPHAHALADVLVHECESDEGKWMIFQSLIDRHHDIPTAQNMIHQLNAQHKGEGYGKLITALIEQNKLAEAEECYNQLRALPNTVSTYEYRDKITLAYAARKDYAAVERFGSCTVLNQVITPATVEEVWESVQQMQRRNAIHSIYEDMLHKIFEIFAAQDNFTGALKVLDKMINSGVAASYLDQIKTKLTQALKQMLANSARVREAIVLAKLIPGYPARADILVVMIETLSSQNKQAEVQELVTLLPYEMQERFKPAPPRPEPIVPVQREIVAPPPSPIAIQRPIALPASESENNKPHGIRWFVMKVVDYVKVFFAALKRLFIKRQS